MNNALSAGLVMLGLLMAVTVPTRVRADDLESALYKQAPKVLHYLKDKGYRNVGVLKFRVQKGDEPASDSAGTLNLTLADRLELALVLADDFKNPVGIIQNASAVAARIPGASHLTPDGRRKLFERRYSLAWGSEEVTADAFLTGVVQVSPDLRQLTVGVLAFDKDGAALDKVVQFKAATGAENLGETGESFLLRGAFDEGKPQLSPAQAVAAAASQVKEREATYPLQDKAAPVELEIRYDGRKVPLEIGGGKALIPEPTEGQKVTFGLLRKDGGKARYGIVLKVNGENTLYRQRFKDIYCRKWVLEPGDLPSTIRGFQLEGNDAKAFRILSRQESKQKEMYYGADVGTISLVVFREKRDKHEAPVLLTDEAEDLAALNCGMFPPQKPKNLAALKEQLRDLATRGLIGEGEKIESKIQSVPFKADPTPVMVATIVYYRP